jgi:hypothetical protein
MKPTPTKPRIIIAHIEGSGTAAVCVGAAASIVILSRIKRETES